MRAIGMLSLALLAAAGLYGQHRGGSVNTAPRITGNFPSVLYPGGTAAMGVQRTRPNILFPGGGGPQLVVPGTITDPTFGLRLGSTVGAQPAYGRGRRSGGGAFAYPVFVPSYVDPYYESYYGAYPPGPPQQPAPNITIIYPPQPAPVVMSPYQPSEAAQPAGQDSELRMYHAPVSQPQPEPSATAEPERYLLAFKNNTVYAARAYWVDGDILHYFTAGNKHNQASLSLVDRELTERLNREAGTEVALPKAN